MTVYNVYTQSAIQDSSDRIVNNKLKILNLMKILYSVSITIYTIMEDINIEVATQTVLLCSI